MKTIKLFILATVLFCSVFNANSQNGRIYDECNAGITATWFGNVKTVWGENSTWASRHGDVYRYALDNPTNWAYLVYEVPAGAEVSKMIVDFYSATGKKPTLAVKNKSGVEIKYVEGWANGMPTETKVGENLYRYVLPKELIPAANFQGCVYLDANSDVEILRVVTEYGTGYVRPDDNANADFSRLDSFMAKVSNGDDITIGVLGGSMTAGANSEPFNPNFPNCYGARVKNYIETTYGVKVNLVNAGIGSTNSFFGTLRAEEHLLKYNPDLVVIEYACNDQREGAYLGYYESLIRKALKAPGYPAVIAAMLCTQAGITLSDVHIPLAQYYKLPIANYNEEVKNDIIGGTKTWGDYYGISTNPNGDGIHPNTLAHQKIADIISGICDSRKGKPEGTLTNEVFEIIHNNFIEDASFLDEKTANFTTTGTWIDGGGIWDFKTGKGWHTNVANSEIVFDFVGDVASIVYWKRPAGENYGKVSVWVDNNAPVEIDGSNGEYIDQYLISGLGNGAHKLHIKALENKHFEIVCVAFSGDKSIFHETNRSIKSKAFSDQEFCFVENVVGLMTKGMPFDMQYTADGYIVMKNGSNYIGVDTDNGNIIPQSTLNDAAKFIFIDKGAYFALRSVKNGKYLEAKYIKSTYPLVAENNILNDNCLFSTSEFIPGPISSVEDVNMSAYKVVACNKTIQINGAQGKKLNIYAASGLEVYNEPSLSDNFVISQIGSGVFFVKIEEEVIKIIL